MNETITYDRNKVIGVVRRLKALRAMANKYASFKVSTGRNRDYPREALTGAAENVAQLARAERTLIDRIVDNIVRDVADLENCDEEIARSILRLDS